jgi:hypothetical protein
MVFVPAAVVLAEGASAPQALELPPAREFLTSAGFGGALALLAALILALIALGSGWRASQRHRADLERREHYDQQLLAEKEHAADVALCDQRFRWVVETAGLEAASSEGATLGLGPELALELLSGLHRDAKRLDDETLAKAIGVYLNQFALVLAQQGGPLSHLNAEAAKAGERKPRTTATRRAAEPEPTIAPDGSGPESEPETAAAPAKAAGSRRRR